MTAQNRTTLKGYFETGDTPTEAQFIDLIDSFPINAEDGADVTDATNVTAAGALMDSEVTNLAAVKAFDPTDYATAAQGSTADSAVQPGGALGTPSSGTLTNCSGLPVSGISASTSTALGVGSLNIGHASDTTLARASAGVLSVEGVALLRATDVASGTITARNDDINFSGGSDGDVLTVQADGSLALEAPPGAAGGDSWDDPVDADIVPDGDGTRDLGSSSVRFAELHVDSIDLNGVTLNGGTDLADPGADRIMFWDDSGGAMAWLEAGTGLSISSTTISVNFSGYYSSGGTDVAVADGGTGRSTSTTAYGLIAAGTTATGAHQTLAAGATTEILVGGGASALPAWTTATGSGAPVRATSPTLVTPALGTPSSGTLTNCTGYPAASTSASGIAEASIASEVNTGTDAARYVSPDSLAGSVFGIKEVAILVFDDSQDVAVADGAGDVFFRVPSTFNGMNLVAVAAHVQTAGTTGTTDIQIARTRSGSTVDMLSTKITIDSTEIDTITAAAAAVINASNDDVATGDRIRIDVDAVSTTAPKGLVVELQFQLP